MQTATRRTGSEHGPIEALLREMAVEEKVSLLSGADAWHTASIKRLGVHTESDRWPERGARGGVCRRRAWRHHRQVLVRSRYNGFW